MRTTVTIKNLQCDSCKNAVAIQLHKVAGISNVHIDITKGHVTFDYKTHNTLEGLRMNLEEIGFPITNDPNRIQ